MRGEGTMIKKVGIIGCGAMGAGIVQAVLEAGYSAVVREIDPSLLGKGLAAVRKGIERSFEKKNLPAEKKEEVLARLSGTVLMKDLGNCDLVIEAAFEDLQVKRDLFKELDAICGKECILASNTSSLSITDIAVATSRPEQVMGLHFFNPVQVMPLVEVIRTIATGQEAISTAMDFVKSLGKTPILARDNPGFIVNLLLTPYLMHAMHALSEGVASIQDIDGGMKLGCGHPMGPLMLADFIGLDILHKAGNVMFEAYKDARFAPPPLLGQMVRMGYLGKKSGKGFYDWTNPRNPVPLSFNV
jgi:3-hydroxybutyryl-CoA dehydrogenase